MQSDHHLWNFWCVIFWCIILMCNFLMCSEHFELTSMSRIRITFWNFRCTIPFLYLYLVIHLHQPATIYVMYTKIPNIKHLVSSQCVNGFGAEWLLHWRLVMGPHYPATIFVCTNLQNIKHQTNTKCPPPSARTIYSWPFFDAHPVFKPPRQQKLVKSINH